MWENLFNWGTNTLSITRTLCTLHSYFVRGEILKAGPFFQQKRTGGTNVVTENFDPRTIFSG